jgi:PGF-pre-PGF domain-containing protein
VGNFQVGVSQVQIAMGTQTEAFAVTAQPVSLGDAMQVQGQPVAGYLQISPVGVSRSTITSGTISFVVSGTWLTTNNIAPANVELMRYSDNQWNALPTTFVSQSGNNYYFSAVTPGFSYFAITVKSQGTTTANATTTAAAEGTFVPAATAITGTAGVSGISATLPATGTPVAAETTVPAPLPGLPFNTIGIAIAALVIIVIAAFLIRRWWIRKQNPALFKNLD